MTPDQQHDEDARNYHSVMGWLRDLTMEHGLCVPRERLACTHCNARDNLDKHLAEYKGPMIYLA